MDFNEQLRHLSQSARGHGFTLTVELEVMLNDLKRAARTLDKSPSQSDITECLASSGAIRSEFAYVTSSVSNIEMSARQGETGRTMQVTTRLGGTKVSFSVFPLQAKPMVRSEIGLLNFILMRCDGTFGRKSFQAKRAIVVDICKFRESLLFIAIQFI